MCGIGGWFGKASAFDLEAMAGALQHRGPDDSGTWSGGEAGLVHTRLAIIDLTPSGKQPIADRPWRSTSDGSPSLQPDRYCLCFNGEIYNYQTLRDELIQSGERFYGESDSEVLLRLLIRKDINALNCLHGMFAFAFWDNLEQRGLLSRDPFGIKPLFYAYDEDGIRFASEFRALRCVLDSRTCDRESIRDTLMWGSCPESSTPLKEIRQLEAGHVLEWREQGIRKHCWARIRIPAAASKLLNTSRSSLTEITRKSFCESIQRHMISDAPLGIFLSGGIDSTTIVAAARKALGPEHDLHTFSIGFHEAEFDESETILKTSRHFNTIHHHKMLTQSEGQSELQPYLESMDLPTNDGFNTWCISKFARQAGIKVVLSGLGGDELFSGYPSFQIIPRLRLIKWLAGWIRRPAAWLGKRWFVEPRIQRFADFIENPDGVLSAYHAVRGIFAPSQASVLLHHLVGPTSTLKSNGRMAWTSDVVSELELTRYMRNQLLRDSDVFGMAHGLEIRVPFVDHKFFQTISRIPAVERLRKGKQHLLDAFPEIPEWVRTRPKQGFRFPFDDWMGKQFGELLAEADRVAPFPLTRWYQRWTLATVLRFLPSADDSSAGQRTVREH